MRTKARLLSQAAPVLGALGGLFALWEGVRRGFDLPAIVLPSPLQVVLAFVSRADYILSHLLVTLGEALAGFALGVLSGVLLAFLFVRFAGLRRALYPLALLLKSTPLIVLAPLLVIWFGSGAASKVTMSAILCFFPILVATYDGLREVDPALLDLLRIYGATPNQLLLKARLPAALPQLLSGCRVAVPLAVVGAVIGEYLSATRGIGHIIANASYHLDTALVFAALATIALSSLSLFGLIVWLERRLAFWYRRNLPGES
jgi:NitT/TauT family transport system permease protein